MTWITWYDNTFVRWLTVKEIYPPTLVLDGHVCRMKVIILLHLEGSPRYVFWG